jgi:hypothetical protein
MGGCSDQLPSRIEEDCDVRSLPLYWLETRTETICKTSVLSIGRPVPQRSRYCEVSVSMAQLIMRLDFAE